LIGSRLIGSRVIGSPVIGSRVIAVIKRSQIHKKKSQSITLSFNNH